MKENYQIILDKKLDEITHKGECPSLFLHACCAPCSSYTLEYLSGYFNITLFYYNPNISPKTEMKKRYDELQKLISAMPLKNPVKLVIGKYDSENFFEMAKGMEDMKEGGERCFKCYEMRLRETAQTAKKLGFDYFTTTLSISPHKNAQKLNEIGKQLSEEYGISYLYSDFKKRGGYKRSCELSELYGLYRQNYCGCVFSKAEAALREKNNG